MSSTPGTPINDELQAGVSIVPIASDRIAQFPSETEVEPIGPSRPLPDELQLFAPEEVAARPGGIDRSWLVWPLVNTATAVAAIAAGVSIGWLMGGDPALSDRRVAPVATRAETTRLPSTPKVAYGAATAAPAIGRSTFPTRSDVVAGRRNKPVSRAIASRQVVGSARPPAVSARQRWSDPVAPVPAVLVPVERPSVLLADAAASPTANPAIAPSLGATEVQVIATASDPDRDELTYRWSAPVGQFANATEKQTVYTCPDSPSTVALTVTVTDSRGGIASDQVTVQCVEGQSR